MKLKIVLSVQILLLSLSSASAGAFESLIELGAEGVVFLQEAPPPTSSEDFSLSLRPKFTHQIDSQGIYLTFEPFFRWDQGNDSRTHADIGEFKLLKVFDQWEFEAGTSKVFWGVAESHHLVDIINQTDALEGVDGEDKLGQPLLRLSRIFEQTTLDAYVLPGFRARQFLGPESRFTLPFEVDSDEAVYESEEGDDHVDFALRYSGYAGQVDYGVSWFKGTSRRPQFIPGSTPGVMVPYYEQMERIGVDVQYTVEAWLWKLEAIRQASSLPSFSAAVGGLEYTLFNMRDGLYDLGLLAEYNYDTRGDPQTVVLQNDLFIATRFAFTDAASSAILAGGFIDMDDNSRIFRLEASRRIFSDATISLEAQGFSHTAPGNASYPFRDNDFIGLDIAWYF